MFKFMAVLGMYLVAFDCVLKGAGISEQQIYAPDNIWLWFLTAIMWALLATGAIFKLKEIQ